MSQTKENSRIWKSTRDGLPVVNCHIEAPVFAVWSVLSDGWMYPEWVVGAARVRDVDKDWPRPGSRIHHSVGIWPILIDDHTEVLESETGHKLVMKARAWPIGEARVELILTDKGNSTQVSMIEDASIGSGRLIPRPVRQALLVPRNTESVRRLALIAEGRSTRK